MSKEKWDLYDRNLCIVHKNVDSDKPIPKDLYHITVNVWITDSKKEVLLIKKALNYDLRYPGFWSSINGNIISGKDETTSIIDIVFNKIGIVIKPSEINLISVGFRDPHQYIYKTYNVKKEIDINKIIYTDKTHVQAKWVDKKELCNMMENGEIASSLIDRIEKEVLNIII